MDKEVIIPSSEETETIILNIEGILNNLKPILDSDTYSLLYDDVFMKIKEEKETVSEVTAKELKRSFPDMWAFYVNMSGSSIRDRLKKFEIVLEPYKKYYDLSLNINRINYLINNPSSKNDKEAISLTIKTINLMKVLNYSFAPELFEEGYSTIYNAVVVYDNEDIIASVNDYPLLRETIGRNIQEYVKNPTRSIEYDGIDHENIKTIRENDSSFISLLSNRNESIEVRKDNTYYNRVLIGEKLVQLNERLEELNKGIKDNINERRFKKALYAALYSILPVCSLTGALIGEDNARRTPLYETETHITDLSKEYAKEIDSYVEYDQTKTDYVSTVMMATPWEKTLSGGDVYSREVTFYDFIKPEDAIEPYSLKKEDLVPSNLVYKYSYNETASGDSIKDKPSLVVTETFQNKNLVKKNQDAVTTGIAGGIFLGFIGLVSAVVGNRVAKNNGKFAPYSFSESKEELNDLNEKLNIVKSNIEELNNYDEVDEIDNEELKELLSTSDNQRMVLKK